MSDEDLDAAIARVRASSILGIVAELRSHGAFEQFPDMLGGKVFTRENKQIDTPLRPGWLPADFTPETGGAGVCDMTMRAAWAKGLLEGGEPGPSGRRRVVLKAPDIIAPIVAKLREQAEGERAPQ